MIIAVDFDGVIVEDKFPEVGKPDLKMVRLLRRAYKKGHSIVLWTCRVNDKLEAAIKECEYVRLPLTVINSADPGNLAEYGTDPRKVYADLYIDDKSVGYSKYKAYTALLNIIKQGEVNDEQR